MKQIIIIGGGAAGMMAAIAAASEPETKVLLLEQNEKLGKKIYITGKGRCNFTNACDFSDFLQNIVSNPKFMYSSGRGFLPEDMIAFLENAGCRTKVERGNRAFPLSDHASDVTKALEKTLRSLGVEILLHTKVTGIRRMVTEEQAVSSDATGISCDIPGKMYDILEAPAPGKSEEISKALPVAEESEEMSQALPVAEKSEEISKALSVAERSNEKSKVHPGAGEIPEERNTDPPGFLVKTNKRSFTADAVIIATGGLSYPSTGATGDGYRFAEAFGIDVAVPVPALVPLNVSGPDAADAALLQGVSLRNVALKVSEIRPPMETAGRDRTEPQTDTSEVTADRPENPSASPPVKAAADQVSQGKAVLTTEPGEMLFTHFGLSGPLILSASSLVSRGLAEGLQYLFSIDLKPALTLEQLDQRLLRDLAAVPNMQMENALAKLLISSLRPVILRRAGIDPKKRARDLGKKERQRLCREIKDFAFTVAGTRGFSEAIITQGGVETGAIRPKTMEAKAVPGLYFAGEVLDVDAYTGGFNLQIAWATGRAAGKAAGSTACPLETAAGNAAGRTRHRPGICYSL